MSWSVETRIVAKQDFERAVIELAVPIEISEFGPAFDQVQAAKRGAIELAKTVPGPYLRATLCGHANGLGWQGKPVTGRFTTDAINVSVIQFLEPLREEE